MHASALASVSAYEASRGASAWAQAESGEHELGHRESTMTSRVPGVLQGQRHAYSAPDPYRSSHGNAHFASGAAHAEVPHAAASMTIVRP